MSSSRSSLCACVQIFSSHKDISHIALGPPYRPHFNLICYLKTPSPNTVTYEVLGIRSAMDESEGWDTIQPVTFLTVLSLVLRLVALRSISNLCSVVQKMPFPRLPWQMALVKKKALGKYWIAGEGRSQHSSPSASSSLFDSGWLSSIIPEPGRKLLLQDSHCCWAVLTTAVAPVIQSVASGSGNPISFLHPPIPKDGSRFLHFLISMVLPHPVWLLSSSIIWPTNSLH